MNLTETYNMTMSEVIAKCNIVDQKVHADNEGNIQAIEVKYVPKGVSNKVSSEIECPPHPFF